MRKVNKHGHVSNKNIEAEAFRTFQSLEGAIETTLLLSIF
jgi:hypothetical protein